MTKKDRERAYQELQDIAKRHNNLLRPRDVVDFARDENTALHGYFTWDDGEAAEKWRLFQARQVIRVSVDMITPEVPKPARVFVSLIEDRKQTDGGYRFTTDVLSDAEMRAKLLREAKAELDGFRRRYHMLAVELAPVFAGIEKVQRTSNTNRKRRKQTTINVPVSGRTAARVGV